MLPPCNCPQTFVELEMFLLGVSDTPHSWGGPVQSLTPCPFLCEPGRDMWYEGSSWRLESSIELANVTSLEIAVCVLTGQETDKQCLEAQLSSS